MEYHTQIKLINNNAIDMLCGKLRLPIGVDNTVANLREEVLLVILSTLSLRDYSKVVHYYYSMLIVTVDTCKSIFDCVHTDQKHVKSRGEII
jgi:hypothetical protein